MPSSDLQRAMSFTMWSAMLLLAAAAACTLCGLRLTGEAFDLSAMALPHAIGSLIGLAVSAIAGLFAGCRMWCNVLQELEAVRREAGL